MIKNNILSIIDISNISESFNLQFFVMFKKDFFFQVMISELLGRISLVSGF